ncbi:YihY/virulence factor BrkB family protein [Deltaproteobacteria bacterium OttesenSCG-928-K17]|nr:YihY/virulence factor BrkB family protein [Deltaproteobacteria bacterium OttesenSCG-928-K17]
MAFNPAKIKAVFNRDIFSELYDKMEQAGIIAWPVKSTALSYYCLMGVVPFLTLFFVVARSFGLEMDLSNAIDDWVKNTFSSVEEQQKFVEIIVLRLKSFSASFIEKSSGSVMVFVALGIIFWSGYKILTLLEQVFGEIFGYSPPRRLIHRIMDYFTVMVIVPLVLMAALTVKIYIAGLAAATWQVPGGIDPSALFSIFFIISPYILLWLVFSWVYSYFSRGLINWRERILGGFITSLLFQVFLSFYLNIMFALTSYNTIYSGFAAIPLFMIWLSLAWLIVLAGGEVTRRFYDLFTTGRKFFSLPAPATWGSTLELARQILKELGKNYQATPPQVGGASSRSAEKEAGAPALSGGGGTSFRQLSRATGAPLPHLGAVINRLLSVGVIVRISGPSGGGPNFLPARSPEALNDDYIKNVLEQSAMTIYN